MGTISKTVQLHLESFQPNQMNLEELTQPGWEDADNYFHETDKKYGTSELRVPAVVWPQTDDDTAAPAPTPFGVVMESLEMVPGVSQIPRRTSRPGSSYIRVGSVKLQSNTGISGLEPPADCNTSSLLKAKHVEPVSFYLCI